MQEVSKALDALSSGKATGSEGILSKISSKEEYPHLLKQTHKLSPAYWMASSLRFSNVEGCQGLAQCEQDHTHQAEEKQYQRKM